MDNIKTLVITSFAFFLTVSFQGCKDAAMENHADLVLKNGNIVTIDAKNSTAQAIVIKNGKIIFVGLDKDVENYIGSSTKVIDLGGKFVMPGFNDSHAHFLGLGESLVNLDLRSAKNWDEVVAIVADAVKKHKPGEWIIGRGWHQEKFNPAPNPNVNGYPIHNELSKISPENPVMLSHASGHAVFANAKAMQLAGVISSTVNPSGGTIVRDKSGNAIGVFEENGENLIRKVYDEYLAKRPPLEIEDHYRKIAKLAADDCLKKGITSCADAGQPFDVIDVYRKLASEELLPVRINVMVQDTYEKMSEKLPLYKLIGYEKGFLTVRSIKQYIDGALGSRGAWLLEPYSDLPNHSGSNVTPIQELKNIAELAIKYGFQMRTHAIGDRGNREVLNIYQEKFMQHPKAVNLRWAVEHAQHLSAQDITRVASLGVIAAMQSVHCTSDMGFVPERLGNKRTEEGAYVWKKIISSGAIICNGTDAPVEDINPIQCFYSAVTRKNEEGKTFYPDQKMTRLEALKSYTVNGAHASFEEDVKGAIEKGKYADLVVLSNDLLKCTDEEIKNTKVLYTIVNGKVLFQSK
ncbi:MAG: amidohydrolase [Stygiobacter sp. RIFOXYC12_FULL_38_8]|nr:MAG: amidohydrolase [Stygiobacter sp. GWC2_38_9]OGU85058.1 MAG: amidohydrolase [Stygiobacter sp. RIFOXYA12_FULL_38_9]OGV07686.1 MAG: amidohydrolase [Stygiobacter sp. RIFOXYB2_FULL_37_11]OGV12689.1 MAG: amidohydrolase [Stygiobacter sp. RIFOXYC2_FULL_38_25]OGV17658.1 MAG: amidohydrolase [Stygiobacter sp. RIFOXYA2_FULL_38_8]OGV26947.1 MAG: amidohydrolase [Stygiobacter sp. RIFOXYC12_FULL_38_8]OGV82054.1 MAG: amidohydrolase [Stygiobacter sp. GWF2_38_21]RJQ58736.1 MAG: amidohydrolase [Stygiobac